MVQRMTNTNSMRSDEVGLKFSKHFKGDNDIGKVSEASIDTVNGGFILNNGINNKAGSADIFPSFFSQLDVELASGKFHQCFSIEGVSVLNR